MFKGQTVLSFGVMGMGLLAAIAHSAGAIAAPVPQVSHPLEGVRPSNTQDRETHSKDFTLLQSELNRTATNASLLNITPFTAAETDLIPTQPDEAVSPAAALDVQVSSIPVSQTAPPLAAPLASHTEPFSPNPQAPLSLSQNPQPNPEPSSTDSQANPEPQSTPEASPTPFQSNRWRFLFQPFLYVPLNIYGDTTFSTRISDGSGSGDFVIESDRITTFLDNDLNFAFFGELQAWSPDYRWGVLTDLDFLSASSDRTFTRPIRFPGLANIIPTELRADLDIEFWSVDLAAIYRIYDPSEVNPAGVATEFDLGLFVFDIIGGANFTSLDADLNLRTNLDRRQVDFDGGGSVLSPLLGISLRINLSPTFALVTAGSVSGFGIGGLTRWNARAGFDWMFSGNTSLGIGYRFGYAGYNVDFDRGEDFGVTLNQNGPYLNFSFRF